MAGTRSSPAAKGRNDQRRSFAGPAHEDVQHAKQTDLDKLGIAKTAREEKNAPAIKAENSRKTSAWRSYIASTS